MAYTKYSLTPGNNTAAPPDGAPEGMLPSAVNDTMRDMMAQIRDCGDGIRGGTYTMTAPVITGGTITGVALTGNTFTSPVISGGSINNTPIGATTANTGAFSTLSATGVTTVQAGSVSAPAITTTGDTNTGIFFPAADTIAFTEGGAESMRIDSSGNVIVSGTSTSSDEATYQSGGVFVSRRASSAGTTHATFLNGGSAVGSITSNTVNTFYNISSDYRLKENATPVTTGLQTILSLNPVNFDWISKNVSDTGFLAHEFQAVIPNSVMGTKDAVDANGNPIYQQIDRSGAIPFLVAAIQELKATVDAQATQIAALENPSVES
jgi:hypothetical protein